MAGFEPAKDSMILTLGADFVHRYQTNPGEDIPAGTTSRIELYASKDTSTTIAVWDAELVDTNEISFRIESEQTDLIPNRSHYRLYVVFPDTPTLDMCWVYGDVKRVQ